MFWTLLGYTVAKVCTSPRNLTWFTRPFLLMALRGRGLGTRLDYMPHTKAFSTWVCMCTGRKGGQTDRKNDSEMWYKMAELDPSAPPPFPSLLHTSHCHRLTAQCVQVYPPSLSNCNTHYSNQILTFPTVVIQQNTRHLLAGSVGSEIVSMQFAYAALSFVCR